MVRDDSILALTKNASPRPSNTTMLVCANPVGLSFNEVKVIEPSHVNVRPSLNRKGFTRKMDNKTSPVVAESVDKV